jgi:tetratricopeptide (TPR) repeat protein
LAQGMYSKAREAVDQAIVLATGANLTARLPLLKYVLMDIDHSEGNFDAEEALLDELWKQAEGEGKNPRDDVNLMWPKTDVLTMKKLFKEAEEACFAIMSYYETHENKKLLRIPFLLQGNLASEAGDQERAIERLSKAVSLLPPGQGLSPAGQRFRRYDASFLYPLALAYFRAGDLEKARREYEEITRMTYGRYLSGDLYAKSFHMLGQVYERLGNKKQARANYQKFLDLWKNADPGRPEVEDAKKRLAAL